MCTVASEVWRAPLCSEAAGRLGSLSLLFTELSFLPRGMRRVIYSSPVSSGSTQALCCVSGSGHLCWTPRSASGVHRHPCSASSVQSRTTAPISRVLQSSGTSQPQDGAETPASWDPALVLSPPTLTRAGLGVQQSLELPWTPCLLRIPWEEGQQGRPAAGSHTGPQQG